MAATSIKEFAANVGVMKPNSVDRENEKQKLRLDKLLDSNQYALEEKIDGCHYKMIGHQFFSTDNVEKTENFRHLKEFFENLRMRNIILDGEIHYPGKTSQHAVSVTGALPDAAYATQQRNGFIHYTIFDILRTPKGNWTIQNTYTERRKMVIYFYDKYVKGTPMEEFIHVTPMTVDNKRRFLEQLLNSGLEGGVLKKLDSIYHMGKKPMWEWMKIKQDHDVDLVIMGFEEAKMEYEGSNIESWQYWRNIGGINRPVTRFYYNGWIGSIIFGAYVNGKLTRICTASGIEDVDREHMTKYPDQYIGKVARVAYMEKTADGYPRHPVFKNIHETKMATECTWNFN